MGATRKRKSIRRNSKLDMGKPHIFYPKEYEGYIGLFTILSILMFILVTAIIIIVFPYMKNLTPGNLLLVVVILLMFYSEPIYMLIFVHKLSSKKIFLLVTSEKVMLKDALISKEIKLKDIEGIRRTKESIYRGGAGLQYIHIYAKKERDKSSSSQIWIRISWFGEETICRFIDSVEEMQKRI